MQEKKLGTFFGIFVPNVTMMFGVIIFLRLSVTAAHTGFVQALMIIALGLFMMLITSASIATIASNMKVGAGGIYYLMTRSLGIEVGGALGFTIYINQLLSIAMTVTAFAYTIVEHCPYMNVMFIEIITLLVLTFVSSASSQIVIKLQGVILIILCIAILSIFGSSSENIEIAKDAKPFFKDGFKDFWGGFAILYVAITGIEAGMALSGNLKNPSRSLKIGNFTSLIFVSVVYTSIIVYSFYKFPLEVLLHDPFIFIKTAYSSKLVTLGIITATLSSALGSLLGGPRILQSMAKDNLVHSIFIKEFGFYKEPRYALVFTTFISFLLIIFTDLNLVIPAYTLVCLITYGLINFTAGISSLVNPPSWRPSFYFPYWASFLGAALCIIAMFMIAAGWSFIILGLVAGFYMLLKFQTINTGFDDIRDSILFYATRFLLYKMEQSDDKAHNWHPNILALSMSPTQNPGIVKFAKNLSEDSGILTFGAVLPNSWESIQRLSDNKYALKSFFESNNINSFVTTQSADSTYEGYYNIVTSYGFGALIPNTIIIPVSSKDDIDDEFINLVKICYLTKKNLLIFISRGDDEEMDFNEKIDKPINKVDLWWNSNDRSSSNFLISLAISLTESIAWKDCTAKLNALIEQKDAMEYMDEFLRDFIKQGRLDLDVSVHHKTKNEIIKAHNSTCDLCLIAIESYDQEWKEADYKEYLQNILNQLSNLQHDTVLVSNLDQAEHIEIFK